MVDPTELTGKHLVAGTWISSDGAPFQAANAKTGALLLPIFHEAQASEVDQAFAAATSAFRATAHLPAPRWAELLEALAIEIQDLQTTLVARAHAETALPEARLNGEIGRTTGQLRLFAELVKNGSWVDAVIDTAIPDRKPLPKPDLRRMLRPLGPVVVFGASNFPFAFGACGGDTASALASGNPVIAKGHPGHPGTNELFAAAVSTALANVGLPAGYFSLLQGKGTEIGASLVQHPDAEAVGFTGSLRGGRALYNLAAARPRPIPVYAEMGSTNPLILLPGALEDRFDAIVEGLAGSITMGVGQFCTKPGVVFTVKGETTDRFVQALAERLSTLPAGTMLNAGLQVCLQESLLHLEGLPNVRNVVRGSASGNADIVHPAPGQLRYLARDTGTSRRSLWPSSDPGKLFQ